jgi:hypothetical protein
MIEDRLLVLRCKRGSSDALRRVYQKYKDDLLVVAMVVLNDNAAAEDVLHDVFEAFFQTSGCRLTNRCQPIMYLIQLLFRLLVIRHSPGRSKPHCRQLRVKPRSLSKKGLTCAVYAVFRRFSPELKLECSLITVSIWYYP